MKPRLPHSLSRILLAFLLLAAPLWHLHVIDQRFMPPAKADLVPVWIAARAAFHHADPYSGATTRQIQLAYYGRPLVSSDHANEMAFAYPAHTLLLFAWTAPLTWSTVRIAFLILLPILTATTVPLWMRVEGLAPGRAATALTLILTLASWPVMWGVHQIQPTLIVASLIAAGCFLLRGGYSASAGLLFALATIKPQLVGPLLLWIGLSSLLRRDWRFLVSFTVALGALLAAATRLVPTWLPRWRTAMVDYAAYRHLRPDLETVFGHWLGLAVSITIAAAAVVILARNRSCVPDSPCFGPLCSLALAATVCLIPTEMAMVYNQVLLIPACFALVFSKPAGSFSAWIRRIAIVQIAAEFGALVVCALIDVLVRPTSLSGIIPGIEFLLPIFLPILLPALLTLFLVSSLWSNSASLSAVEPALRPAQA